MDKHIILCIHITNRLKRAPEVQQIFTRYGSNIKTRLGLHEISEDFNSPAGVIVLEMAGKEQRCFELAEELRTIDGVEVKEVVFTHP